MEALVILFVVGVFAALQWPYKDPEPKKAGDQLLEGLIAAAKDIKKELED